MVTPKSCILACGVVVCSVLLTGCETATGQYDYDFSESSAVGEWQSKDTDIEVDLILRDDGTFLAHDWPAVLNCGGVIPNFTRNSDALWRETVDFEGTWTLGGDGVEYTIWFLSTDDACQSNWSADAWSRGGQSTEIRIDLNPLGSSESVSEAQYIYFQHK